MIIVKKVEYLAGPLYTVAIKDRDGISDLATFASWHEAKDYLAEHNIKSYRWCDYGRYS